MPQLLFANNASTTLAVAISNSQTTLQVAAGTGSSFPSPGAGQYFKITILPASGTTPAPEILHVTSVSSDTFTVLRGQEGTTAQAWGVSSVVDNLITRDTLVAMAQMSAYAGNPNTYVAGQAGSSTSAPSFCWDYTNNVLYACTTTGSAAAAGWSQYYKGPSFTPVQQGGGTGQGTNKIYIGWDGTQGAIRAEVDATDIGWLATQSYVSSAVAAEATLRSNADTTLQNNINAEATARSSAISSEATARSNADVTLQNEINNLFSAFTQPTGSRSLNIVYTNSTGRAMFVSVIGTTGGINTNLVMYVNGVQVYIFGQPGTASATSACGMVQAGGTYEFVPLVNTITLNTWTETY